jgi:hypothetical protein
LTTSQKTTVTIRNSWDETRLLSGWPHCGQNLARSTRPLPQFGQVAMPGVCGNPVASAHRMSPVLMLEQIDDPDPTVAKLLNQVQLSRAGGLATPLAYSPNTEEVQDQPQRFR